MKFNRIFRSIRIQLLISFLGLILIISSISIVSIILLNSADKIRSFKEAIDEDSKLLENVNVLKLRFLLDESSNYEFHERGESSILQEHDSLLAVLIGSLNNAKTHHEIKDFEMESQLGALINNLEIQEETFQRLILSVKERGFKDFGLIGSMRENIHKLEKKSKYISIEDILMLRRHEKDYLLRKDALYAGKLNALASQILNKTQNLSESKMEKECLEAYIESFNQLVAIQNSIGEFGHLGLLEKLNQRMIYLDSDVRRLSRKAQSRQRQLLSNIENLYYLSAAVVVLFGVFLSFYLANRRSKSLRDLAHAVKEKEIDIHNPTLNIDMSSASKELERLYDAFNLLLNKVSEQIITIEQKSETLKEQNEELKKVNHELDSFVYSVSHDLRSPLASVLGLIHLTRNEKDTAKIKEYNDLKEKSILKLDNFIKDIINLSRNARKDVDIVEVDFNDILDEVFDNHRFYKDAERVQKLRSVNQSGVFYSDPQRISVIMNNLISNAIRYNNRFNKRQYVDVDIRVYEGRAEIIVKDNGMGISEEHLTRIFDMFYRATDENMGSGLGLYITNETLKKINGKINVKSELGKGTSFKVVLPSLTSPKEINYQFAEEVATT